MAPLPMATPCPACPQPGINVPKNWNEVLPVEQQYVVLAGVLLTD